MKVYHYSKLDKWEDIQQGSWASGNKPGLGANLRVGVEDEEARELTAVWAFLSPVPEEWVVNSDFPKVWDFLKVDIGKVLVEIDIDIERDQVFVIDWGHMEGYLNRDKENPVAEAGYSHGTRAEAERAYVKTKIPLKEFMERRSELQYTLPEIIITENIPLEKIKISEEQPLLKEWFDQRPLELESARILEKIKDIPELKSWYAEYKRKRMEGEQREGESLVSKARFK